MKLISRVMPAISSALLAVALAGCAAAPEKGEAHAHASTGTSDPQAMCERHRKMMSGKSPAELQAMQAHMETMKPEMRQKMQAMHENCK